MPNVKIYVNQEVLEARKPEVLGVLDPLRDALMSELGAPKALCHLSVMPMYGLSDQAEIVVDIHYLAKPDRTPEMVTAACHVFRDLLADRLGLQPDIRAIALASDIYVALRSEGSHD